MTRVIYVNGHYRDYDEAFIHAEDRGFQFGDAIYEVIEVLNGALIDETRHIERLGRSLRELKIESAIDAGALRIVMRETLRRNRVRNGLIYLQVSRGVAPRDFLFPEKGTPRTVVCLARHVDFAAAHRKAEQGISVITKPDPRWARCDIKTVMLLPASLAKEEAREQGAQEVWFVDGDGHVTEGGSSNAWIVTPEGTLVKTPATNAILRGVTRMTTIDCLTEAGITFEERQFTVDEARGAREAFITSATNLVMPVIAIDGRPLGNGHPGSVSAKLRSSFHSVAEAQR
ncbi:MAG: D-amino-acid transaminase [Pseudomonadota bacterium]